MLRLLLCVLLLLRLLLCVIHVVPAIVIVVGVPLCCCVVVVIVLSLSDVVDCYSAILGIVACAATPAACVCHLFSFVLPFSFVASFGVSFVSFVSFSKRAAIPNQIVVVVSFSSILSFSFGIVVPVAAVSSVAFSFVLSFAFSFSFVVLPFSFVHCVHVHGCLSFVHSWLLRWMIVWQVVVVC